MATPARFVASCSGCGDSVDIRSGKGTWREVRGFEPIREGGGTNQLVGRKLTGAYLCRFCVDVARSKLRGSKGWDQPELPWD